MSASRNRARARRSALLLATATELAAASLALSCGQPGPPREQASAPEAPFVERARELGLDFVHFNGRSGALYVVEVMGSGAALFDFDGDGDLDVYLVQGAMLGPNAAVSDALTAPAAHMLPLGDRLYRNDLARRDDGRDEARFVDITAASGIRTVSYGMGVAVGDVDGDGWLDLYRTAYGANTLWRNRGDGTFEDTTARAGLGEDSWSAGASFADYDHDGDLDLFLTRYVDFRYGNHQTCHAATSAVDYCGPASYRPLPDRLWRNRGDGTFEDVSTASGVGRVAGPGLGVVAGDFDGDGQTDFFVANDGSENFLWLQQRDGVFEEQALLAGVAVNAAGATEAGMGVDAADLDDDGDEELFLTHLVGETNTLYFNHGGGAFEDRSRASGLGPPSFPHTAFGTAFFDYDNDGRLDLLVANGAVRLRPELVAAGDPFPLHERNQLFRGLGDARFEDVSSSAGSAFELSEVSRAAAAGDLDNDGDSDLVLTNNGGPVRFLENRVGERSAWISFDVAAGTRLDITTGEGGPRHRRAKTDGSYLAANDSRVIVGLGRGGAESALDAKIAVNTVFRKESRRLVGLLPGLRYALP